MPVEEYWRIELACELAAWTEALLEADAVAGESSSTLDYHECGYGANGANGGAVTAAAGVAR
jgi:hypothetical protein